MTIAAANVAPDLALRRSLTASELQRVSDACVIFEHEGLDDDMAPFWVYTVGGYLDGQPLPHGCTVKGDAIVISGMSGREEADHVAALGLQDTLNALDDEHERYSDAQAALQRLAEIGPVERMTQAAKPISERNEEFMADQAAIRPLIGDDIVMATGTQEKPAAPH